MKENEADGVLVSAHKTLAARVDIGQTCMLKLALEMPAVVDGMDDAVGRAYGGMPERLYLIGTDGSVAYKGGMGPMFFKPAEWEEAIAAYLDEA